MQGVLETVADYCSVSSLSCKRLSCRALVAECYRVLQSFARYCARLKGAYPGLLCECVGLLCRALLRRKHK